MPLLGNSEMDEDLGFKAKALTVRSPGVFVDDCFCDACEDSLATSTLAFLDRRLLATFAGGHKLYEVPRDGRLVMSQAPRASFDRVAPFIQARDICASSSRDTN
jgi:hypothetical protein